MPNIGKVLKDEIQRLARKEGKALTLKLRKDTVAAKKVLAGIKKRIAQLERTAKQLIAQEGKRAKLQPPAAEAAEALRFSAKGIRSLRRKLKLSQADFAKLAGVSSLSVYQWERKEGRLNFRGATKTKIAEIRGLGAKGARKRLEEIPAKKPRKAARLKKRGRKKRTAR
jgi:DNA-binding transcriptional regulator YiaG